MGVPAEITCLPARNEVVHAHSAHTKARRIFGETATVPLEEGIARMARWVQAKGPRQTPVFQHIEVQRNLPPSWQVNVS